MDNLNILLKYLVNNDDVRRIASEAGVDGTIVEKTCVLLFDELIPSDFSRHEGSHLEKKDLNSITSNFNKVLEGNSLKKIISDVALDNAVEQKKVAIVVKELLVNIRGRLQYMTAAKKKPEPVQEEKTIEKSKEEPKEENVTRVEKRKPVNKKEVEEEVIDDQDEEELSKGEKIALYVVGALLVAVIVVIVIILIKIRG